METSRKDRGSFLESEHVGIAVLDREPIRWVPQGHLEKFDRTAIAAAAEAFAWRGEPSAAALAVAEARLSELRREPISFKTFLARHPEWSTVEGLAAGAFSLLPGVEPSGRMLEFAAEPYETIDVDGNLLTTAGLNRITSLIIGAGGQAYNNANSRIGVGNSATAATVADTDLNAAAGAGNRQFVLSDATWPQQANGVITEKATFTTGLANFAWAEWGIDNGTANGTTVVAVLLNHKVTALGTKTSAASWVFTVTITLT